MAVEVINLLSPGVLLLGAVLILLVGVVLFLTLTQKHLKKKLSVRQAQMQRFQKFYGEIEQLRSSQEPPETTFKKLDEYVKSTLKERFQLGDKVDYSAMMHLFNTLDKKHLAQFCNQMLQVMYSGDKVDKKRLEVLINNFETIVREERIRPVQRVAGERVASSLIKPKPLPSQTQTAKKPLPADIFKKSIENTPVITPPIKTIPAKPITLEPKAPTVQLTRRLPAQITAPMQKPVKKRSWWMILLGIPAQQKIVNIESPKITGEPKILSPSQELMLKDEAIQKQKLKTLLTPSKKEFPKKRKRTFLQWLLGIHPEQLQTRMYMPGVDTLKQQDRPPQPPVMDIPEKKKGFFGTLFEKKEKAPSDVLPDLTVPELPELFPTAPQEQSQPQQMPQPVQAPPRSDGSWSYANRFGGRKELTIPSQSATGVKKLPNDSFEIYTVKEAITRPESEPQFVTPKSVKSAPSVPAFRENKHIEGIDSMDRIKNRIEMIHKLRREAKLEK